VAAPRIGYRADASDSLLSKLRTCSRSIGRLDHRWRCFFGGRRRYVVLVIEVASRLATQRMGTQELPSGIRIIELIVMMAPAYIANMAPTFLRFWHGPNPPVSQKWLGDHKTIGGFIVATFAGIVVAWMIAKASSTGLLDWVALPIVENWFWFGSSMGFAAILGDSIKSFFKRQLHIQPGASWIPFDQLDFVIAALLVIRFWIQISWIEAGIIIAVSFLGDVLINQISYRIGIKRAPW
jgi:CDP-2,3-bis-(O-geranylgeranyl)-sn-glycerol synthase